MARRSKKKREIRRSRRNMAIGMDMEMMGGMEMEDMMDDMKGKVRKFKKNKY